MRLHDLRITAFGPFAGTVQVDFDELSAGGLFLLTGSTGAGKTSVLDAVSFALYGQVPGDRAGAKHLRSDHAAPQTAPEVVLRFSIGERQFTFTRSPAWSRPKLRGSGETRVQAHVLAEELRDGAWVTLTNRLDDAGLLITHLLGMTATQFTQVALLPQGRFQTFLRASSAERHDVLQQLFRTDRFERVEHWLVERRTTARRASEQVAASVRETLSRLREAAGEEGEPAWDADLDLAAETGELHAWVEQLTTASTGALAQAEQEATRADEELGKYQRSAAEAHRVHELRLRGQAALADLAALAAEQAERTVTSRRIALHHRAAPLAALASAGADQARIARAAADRWEQHRARVAQSLDLPAENLDRAELTLRLTQARAGETLARGFAPRAEALRVAGLRRTAARAELQAVETGVAEIEVLIAAQPAVISEAVAAVHEARAAAGRLPIVLAAVERTEALIAEARRAEVISLELTAARTDVLAAVDVAQQSKEQYLDLREARINGMASELAGQLASGCSCPVCGSADHPSPARVTASGVGRAEEETARKVSEDAAFELQARQVGLATLESELRALDDRLGDLPRDTFATRLQDAVSEAERLEPLVSALDVLADRELRCRAELQAAEKARGEALLERAALRAEIEQSTLLIESIERDWQLVLAEPGAAPEETESSDVDSVVRLRGARAEAFSAALGSLGTCEQARESAESSAAAVHEASLQAGFASSAEALAALVGPDELGELTALLRDAEVREHAATLTTADPDVARALGTSDPDLPALDAEVHRLTALARSAVSLRDSLLARSSRLAALAAELDDQVRAWEPLRADHRLAAGLAALVEGKSVDNPLRMRLAAYVLAERLRQVVAAANERLARMTDQRYALEHTDDRGYGEQRGGLSLRVRDDWNGVRRDPATLSGGETFVVSLALALGLADTVAHEAGGTDIDTLFIDEGFGSLDADTLEDVMDTLDSLRDGGRIVGVVSHVPELRSRITTQLEVSKGRHGSTVRAAMIAG